MITRPLPAPIPIPMSIPIPIPIRYVCGVQMVKDQGKIKLDVNKTLHFLNERMRF